MFSKQYSVVMQMYRHQFGEWVESSRKVQFFILLVILVDVFAVWSEITLYVVTSEQVGNVKMLRKTRGKFDVLGVFRGVRWVHTYGV